MLVDTAQRFMTSTPSQSQMARLPSFLSRRKFFVVVCQARMDAELEKLVESGKLTSRAAEVLDTLRPGAFCLYKSWGFGRVAEWNLLLNQIVIDFTGKKGHSMQLQYAAENLAVIPPEHFLARKATDLMSIKQLAKQDPAGLIRNVLESFGGKATVQEISEWLVGDIFTEAEWKRWWESTKKVLKASGYFSVPVKKNEPVQLRTDAVSKADELIASFNQANKPREKAEVLDQIVRLHAESKEPERQLKPIVTAVETAAMRNQKLHPELSFDLIISRDELLEEMLYAIEREKHQEPGRGDKFQRLLVEDRQLLREMFANEDASVARDAIRRLQLSPLFDELSKRSLHARIVTIHAQLESMI